MAKAIIPTSSGLTALRGNGSRPEKPSWAPDSLYLGRMVVEGEIDDKLHYEGPLHSVLFGPNGSGKGMRILVPNLLTLSGKSIVVVDPKGQLAAMTALHRHRMGDEVKIIDPFGVVAEHVRRNPPAYKELFKAGLVQSAGFNPLDSLDPDAPTFYEDAAVISEAMIEVSEKDPHWGQSAQGIMTGLIMWEKKRNGTKANLENVRAMLTEADDWERFEDEDGQWREGLKSGLPVTAKRMVKEGGYEIASLGGRFADHNRSDEINSIISTADTQTRWLLSRVLRKDLKTEEFGDMKNKGVDFRKLKEGNHPMTVYVVLPSKYLETHNVWLRLVISDALRSSLTTGGRRTLLILDEAAALGHLPIIERWFPVTRDYRVQMWPIFQDIIQIKRLYPQSWETLIGMAGVVQSFRAANQPTAEWLSQHAGNTTIPVTTYNEGKSIAPGQRPNLQRGFTTQPTERAAFLPQQLSAIPTGYLLAWFAGMEKTVPLFAPHYTKVKSLAARALPNPYHGE